MHIPTLNDLKRSLDISEQIEKLQNELAAVLGGLSNAVAPKGKRGRKAQAHTASASSAAPKAKRKMSAAGRARIIAAQKARWARAKAGAASEAAKSEAKKTVAKAKEVVSGGEISAPVTSRSGKTIKKKAARKASKK